MNNYDNGYLNFQYHSISLRISIAWMGSIDKLEIPRLNLLHESMLCSWELDFNFDFDFDRDFDFVFAFHLNFDCFFVLCLKLILMLVKISSDHSLSSLGIP